MLPGQRARRGGAGRGGDGMGPEPGAGPEVGRGLEAGRPTPPRPHRQWAQAQACTVVVVSA